MKTKLFFIVLSAVVFTFSLTAKNFETQILHLDCSVFTQSAANEMSSAEVAPPHNWESASGVQWTSGNCFAAMPSTPAHIGKAVCFGSGTALEATGSAVTPALDLRAGAGEQVSLSIKITAGSNKSGSMVIKADDTVLGTITAATDGDVGAAFTGKYYTFTYPVTNGTAASQLHFIHSKTEIAGNLYVQEIKVIREPVSLVKLDCSLFTSSTGDLNTAAAPHNWVSCLGSAVGANTTSSRVYSQNQATFLGKSIRLGGTAGNGNFTISGLNLAAPENTKVKLYFETAVGAASKDWKLDVNVDANPLTSISTLNFDGTQYYEYDLEITGGTASSSLTFSDEIVSGTGSAQIYIRNLRVYYESTLTDIQSAIPEVPISIYPNPFTDELNVSTSVKSFEIFSLTGQKLKGIQQTNCVSTADLSKGYYILRLTGENGNVSIIKGLKK